MEFITVSRSMTDFADRTPKQWHFYPITTGSIFPLLIVIIQLHQFRFSINIQNIIAFEMIRNLFQYRNQDGIRNQLNNY